MYKRLYQAAVCLAILQSAISNAQTTTRLIPLGCTESELGSGGCISFSLNNILTYIKSTDVLVNATLLLYEENSVSWRDFVNDGEYYVLHTVNRHGEPHRSPTSQLNITSRPYYERGWRGFDVYPLIRHMQRRISRGLRSADDLIHLRAYKTKISSASHLSIFSLPATATTGEGMLLKLEYLMPETPTTHSIERVRRKRDLEHAVTDSCSGSSNTQPCCVSTAEINLDSYTGSISSLFVSPRNFNLRYCKGMCGAEWTYPSQQLLKVDPLQLCCHPYDYEDFRADFDLPDGRREYNKSITGFSVKSCRCG